MQYFEKEGLLLNSLYKGEQGPFGSKGREGFGWQLFLNGFMYIGYWRDNKAHGAGTFIYNDGTIMQGKFYSNRFVHGVVYFASGAQYEEAQWQDKAEEFHDGVFLTANNYRVDIQCRKGNLVRGSIRLSPHLARNLPTGDRTIPFNFTSSKSEQRYIVEGNFLVLPGEEGLVLKHKRCSITEGKVLDYYEYGNCVQYYSPMYYVTTVQRGPGETTSTVLRIKTLTDIKLRSTGQDSEIYQYNFFSGFTVTKRSEGAYSVELKWIDDDYITLDDPLEPHMLNKDMTFEEGFYHYRDENGDKCRIRFRALGRVEQHDKIYKQRVRFDLVLKSIFKRCPDRANAVKEVVERYYSHQYWVWEDIEACEPSQRQPTAHSADNLSIKTDESPPAPSREALPKRVDTTIGEEMIGKRTEPDCISPLSARETDKRTAERGAYNLTRDRLTGTTKLGKEDNAWATRDPAAKSELLFENVASTKPQFRLHDASYNITTGVEQQFDIRSAHRPTLKAEDTSILESEGLAGNTMTGQQREPSHNSIKPSLSLTRNFCYRNTTVQEKCDMDSFITGDARISLADKRVNCFKGKCVNGKLEGPCELECSNNVSVQGTFSEGRLDGYTLIGNAEETYAGYFRAGKPVGRFQLTKHNQTTIGTFKNGRFVPKVIRRVSGVPVEMDETHVGPLNGTYTVELIDYDLTCAFENDELVPRQADCLLKKRNAEETYKGKLTVEKSESRCVFITEDRIIFTIDIESRRIAIF